MRGDNDAFLEESHEALAQAVRSGPPVEAPARILLAELYLQQNRRNEAEGVIAPLKNLEDPVLAQHLEALQCDLSYAVQNRDREVTPARPKKAGPWESLSPYRGVEGSLTVRAVIDLEGRMQCVRVLRGIPGPISQVLLESFANWRFEPALRAGVPVTTSFLVTIQLDRPVGTVPRPF